MCAIQIGCEQDRAKAIELSRGQPGDVTACTGHASAQCYESKAGLLCHPTTETCQASLAYSKQGGEAIDADCRSVE